MIYLDNAATTYPKPNIVLSSIKTAITQYGANPGRSGHTLSLKTAEKIYECREELNNMFGGSGAENVVFTQNCTHSINAVLKGILKTGDHVITTCLEHNAVIRPLYSLEKAGVITFDIVSFDKDNVDSICECIKDKINTKTKLIITTNASNVFGILLPIDKIGEIAKKNDLIYVVDGAQTAGIEKIDVKKMNIDYLCAPGHKGLYGPTGTGFIIINNNENLLTPLIEGGTGSNSVSIYQPDFYPDRLESGTINTVGIIGLCAGIKFINEVGLTKIKQHEIGLIKYLYSKIKSIKGINLYTKDINDVRTVLSFNYKDKNSEEIVSFLNKSGIAVRGGLHCAPEAHKFMGTLDTGTVRISPSIFSTRVDMDKVVNVLKNI